MARAGPPALALALALFVSSADALAPYLCPQGIDCAARNSCPAMSTVCPVGWFCGSYLGHAQEALLDKAWAVSLKDNGVTGDPAPPADRWTEARCFKGWYCPNATTILRCPAGSWCMEGVAAPQPCDAPAACAEGTTFPVSFALPIIFAVVSAVLMAVSAVLVTSQARAEAASRKLQASGASAPESALAAAAEPMASGGGLEVEFEDLGLAIGGRAILAGVSGRAPAATVTAFMGPSGSGKTSLMNALRGSLPAGAQLSGSVRVTAELPGGGRAPVPARLLPTMLGFVAQDDIMDRSLTARELFTFSALARLPRGTPRREADAVVAAALRDLNLEGVADVVVGGGENAAPNISGGQLKRVSIGIELVARPRALFLDEPTSGLDATGALDLMRCLRGVCERQRIAVVCVLHQPRAEAFDCVSRLLLLARGGRVAFEGAAAGCVPHLLAELRRVQPAAPSMLPKGTNPADWIVDCLGGRVKGSAALDLAAAWESSAAMRTAERAAERAAAAPVEAAPAFVAPPPPPGFAVQALLSAQRALLFRLRDWRALRFFLLLHFFMAVSLSPGFSPFIQGRYTYIGPNPPAFLPFVPPLVQLYASTGDIASLGLQQMAFFMTIACGSAGGFMSIALFGSVRAVLRREAAAGADLVAIGAGRMVADVVLLTWCALAFSAVWVLFAHAGHWWRWLGVIFGCVFATSGVAQTASLLTRPTNAAVLLFLFVITQSVFSGIEPHLRQVTGLPVINLVWLLSAGTYVAQGVWGTYVEPFRAIDDVDRGAADFGFDVTSSGVGAATGALIGLGLMWRALALLVLWRQQRAARGGARAFVGAGRSAGGSALSLSKVGLALALAAAAAAPGAAASAVGVSTSCANAAAAALNAAPLNAGACAGALRAFISSPAAFASCTDGGACLADTYLAAVNAGDPLALYRSFKKADTGSSSNSSAGTGAGAQGCSLCGSTSFAPADCVASVAQLVAGARDLSGALGACSNAADTLGLTLLRDQAVAVCARSDARVLAKVPGSISSARYSQCVICGVVRCGAGMVCARDAPPAPCPSGFYCPDGGFAPLPCPSGSFCPQGAERPVECRALAAGSCAGSGAAREVVWAPLVIALAATGAALALARVLEARRTKRAAALAARAHEADAEKVAVAFAAAAGGGASPVAEAAGGGASPVTSGGASPRAGAPRAPRAKIGVRLTFDALTLATRGVTRLDSLKGAVRPGRVTAILGGSGAGKTTLMNVLLGKEAATGGAVSVVAVPLGASPEAAAGSFSHANPLRAAGAGGGGGAGGAETGGPAGSPEVALSAGELRRALGFVPQTDVLIRELSLRESVLHSALTRLPRTLSRAEAAERADDVLEALGLAHVADSLVGDESARGVSGGERKRLNIALELVADPLVLFLDEPTTGLDSAAALGVVEALRRLARGRGITVVAVVHQPRQEIVEAIDDLVLLGRGGRPVFLGPRALALDYLTDALGYELPSTCSPADFLLDVANGKHGLPRAAPGGEPVPQAAREAGGAAAGSSGKAEGEGEGEGEGKGANVVVIVEALAAAWRAGGEAWVRQRSLANAAASEAGVGAPAAAAAAATATGGGGGVVSAGVEAWSTQLRESLRPRRPFLEQVQLHAARAALQRLRGSSLAVDLVSFLIGGAIIGIVLSGGNLLVPQAPLQYFLGCPPGSERYCMSSQRIMFAPATFYFTMIVGAQSVAPAVRVFGSEREVAWREAGVGVSALAYFLGKLLVELPVWCLLALNFSAPLVAIAPMRGPFGGFFALALTCIAVCSSIATGVSAWFGTNSDAANLAGVIIATVLNLFGGFVPLIGTGAVWSYTHWTARAFVAIELSDGYGLSPQVFRWVVGKEWEVAYWPRDLGILWLISALAFSLAFVISVTRFREKRL